MQYLCPSPSRLCRATSPIGGGKYIRQTIIRLNLKNKYKMAKLKQLSCYFILSMVQYSKIIMKGRTAMRKITALILSMTIVLTCGMTAFASTTTDRARTLYELGLLKGTGQSFSEEGLELSRNATRAEVSVTIVRMLGKEQKASYQANEHPFYDVPSWASHAIGWLYENYLVNGTSDTYFGAEDIATVKQFATMLLRVLGYSDAKGDFSYDGSVSFAVSKGLLPSDAVNRYELSRSEMIDMCYAALRSNIKNSQRSLITKLCDERAVDSIKAESLGLLKAPSISDSFAGVPDTLGAISASWVGNRLDISFENPKEHFGLRIFMREGDSGAISEIKTSGTPYFQKDEIKYISGDPAGYVSKLMVYGLIPGKKYSFIVLKTSSEDVLYVTFGKSAPITIG